MLVTALLSPKSTVSSAVAPLKALCPMLSTLLPMVKVFSEVHKLKSKVLIAFKEAPITTDSKLLQPAKALFNSSVTESGIVRDIKDVHL